MHQPLAHPGGAGAFRAALPLVLASASPRRLELLGSLGLAFLVDAAQDAEPLPQGGEDPAAFVRRAAQAKARETATRHPGSVVLGADTIVVLDATIMGKPGDAEEAVCMLTRLAGRTHRVLTGCCLVAPDGSEQIFDVDTEVTMRRSSLEELQAYAATGEPLDKAGAYAIQGLGGFLVRRVEGSYTNVVGLPLSRVLQRLIGLGAVVPAPV